MYAIPGYTLLPLRLFLGLTFIYAGFQKLTDPGYFTLGSRTYIGTQLLNFSHNSPIQFALRPMLEHSTLFGALTIMVELAVGFLVLIGLFTRLASLVGLGLNLILFLSASWNVYPYFLGSDIVFVMAWLTLVITGPGGYALDSVAGTWLSWFVPARWARLAIGPLHPSYPDARTEETPVAAPAHADAVARTFSRRMAIVGGVATAVVFLLGLVPRPSLSAAASSTTRAPTNPTPGTSGSATGTKIASTSQVVTNSGLAFTAINGDPGVLVHAQDGNFYAYDAVCTHAGCTVQYDPQYKLLVCPCHGGAFDPTRNAQVVAGPPPAPLSAIPIKIDANGNVYAT